MLFTSESSADLLKVRGLMKKTFGAKVIIKWNFFRDNDVGISIGNFQKSLIKTTNVLFFPKQTTKI